MIIESYPFREIASFVEKNQKTHYEDAMEIALHDEPNIDMDYYLTMSDAGQCIAVVLLDDGEIVGYSVFIIGNASNHKHIKEAVNTALWVKKEYRGKWSFTLVREAEKILFAMVDEISYNVPSDRIGCFLGKLGYKSQYTVWRTRKCQNQ